MINLRRYQKGYTATWPKMFPLLDIDQIWINHKFTPLKLDNYFANGSDHSMLIGSFIID